LLLLLLPQVIIDERGAVALMQLLDHTPTLQQLDLCRWVTVYSGQSMLIHNLSWQHTNHTVDLLRTGSMQGCGSAYQACNA
jgi:hypothetical protein